jgi:hypothetical protein
MTSPSERQGRPPAEESLVAYLASCREIAALCSQNGWIDNTTLAVEVLDRGQDQVLAAVTFEEVIMEGAGCIAGRVPCYGRVRARLGPAGEVLEVQVL